MTVADSEPIVLPTKPAPPRRASWPFMAALVPVAGGVGMWAVTGSLMALCFAALGPLMAIATVVDRSRGGRKDRRRIDAEHREACERVAARIAQKRDLCRTDLLRQEPDLAALVADASRVWRCRADQLTVGRGSAPSGFRATGGEGDEAERLRALAQVVDDVPISVSVRDGICVRGDRVIALAVARALVAQACLRQGPGSLRVMTTVVDESWIATLPHAQPGPHDEDSAGIRIVLADSGDAPEACGAAIVVADRRDDVPETCAVLIELGTGLNGELRRGAHAEPVYLEACSRPQAESVSDLLRRRGASMVTSTRADEPVMLAALEPRGAGDGSSLSCTLGRHRAASRAGSAGEDHGDDTVVDLVADGPHALVVGTTGAGKSELLTTWVTSLARSYTTERVVFLLADFKGGTAFDALREVPHVTGVITDLDGETARRAVESLRAEIRRRESILAAAGARDVADVSDLPRLVIVVDEFAAMLHEHPDLHAVFSDVAARGRALGMHLILGTQRSTGVVRDALAANCPLRIALRVAEASESRGVIGSDAAARLPGSASARGLAYLRRPSDGSPSLFRVALTTPGDVTSLHGSDRAAQGPWMEPLPAVLSLQAARGAAARTQTSERASIVLGVIDDPPRQRQITATMGAHCQTLAVLGASGSGKTEVCRLVRSQCGAVIDATGSAEHAWDALCEAEEASSTTILIDDVDAVIARYPTDYAHALAERVERIVREANERENLVVVTAARTTGATARLLDLFSRRALLRLPTKAEHAAAGGDITTWSSARVAGRAVIDGQEMQFALAPAQASTESSPQREPPLWIPPPGITGVVVRAPHRRIESLAAGWGDQVEVVLVDQAAAEAAAWSTPTGAPTRSDHHPDVAQQPTMNRRVIVGDGEGWQRQFGLVQQVRSRGVFVVSAECSSDLRAITGERELPPFALSRAARAWEVTGVSAPRRVTLPPHTT